MRECTDDGGIPPSGVRQLTVFEAMPDPLQWTRDRQSGLRFRRSTQAERRANGWEAASFVVEGGSLFRHVGRGGPNPRLVIPTADATSRLVRFKRRGSMVGPLMVETRAVGAGATAAIQERATQPVFHRYQSSTRRLPAERRRTPGATADIRGALMVLTAADGGVYARGAVDGFEVEAHGPSHGWVLDRVAHDGRPIDPTGLYLVTLYAAPPAVLDTWGECSNSGICDAYCGYLGGPWPFAEPDGNANPCSEPFNPGNDFVPATKECGDGIDNDGDGEEDLLDLDCDGHLHEDDAEPHLHRYESGRDLGLFGEVRICTMLGAAWSPYMLDLGLSTMAAFRGESGPLDQKLRWAVASCWLMDSGPEATACAETGDCAPFSTDPAVYPYYPYAGANGHEEDYRNHVDEDLWRAKVLGLVRPIASLHVVHAGQVIDNDVEAACGVAQVGTEGGLDGRSVASVYDAACAPAWKVTAHEVGHTFGADHETYPALAPHTFMKSGQDLAYGFLNYFSPTSEDIVNLCFADVNCPRMADLGHAPQ